MAFLFFRIINSFAFVIGITTYSVCVSALNSSFEPKLEIKGTAAYHALGKDYYIANLYVTDSSQDALVLLAENKPQKMKVKVIAKRWSARKWKAQWQNNIVINNEMGTDSKLAQALLTFTDFPVGSLRAGDEVIIDYIPEVGSRVYFNTHEVIITEDAKLYAHLLNTWLGKFSLNRVFREKISGATVPEYDLLVLANKILPQDRIDEVDAWFISAEEKRNAERAQALLIAEAIKKQQQDELAKKKALAQKRVDEAAVRQAKMLLAEQKRVALKMNAEMKQKAEAPPKKISLQYQMAMQDYYQQLYLWQLQNKVNKSVVYPEWVKDFSDQELVEISFATDLEGTFLNFVNKSPRVPSVLVEEVANRIVLALKESQRPAGLEGNRWSFTMNYLFDPTRERIEPLVKPQQP